MSQVEWMRRTSTRYGIAAGSALLAFVVLGSAWQPLLATDGFMPQGASYAWRPGLVGLHLISDMLIGIAYFSIPVALIYFRRKRRDSPFNWMFVLFGLFSVACGATHWMGVWTLWYPLYWLSGVVKAITAAVSIPTAVALVFLIPRILAIPSPTQLRQATDALEEEVAERRRAEAALLEARASSEQRVEEAQREAREEAEAANRLKDEFLATVSHELRSPLNSIVGWLHVLENAPIGAPEARQAIDKIRRNVDTQARLISDLLDVSRIITGKLHLEIRRVDPLVLLEGAVESVRAAADAKRIDLTLAGEPLGVRVSGDPDRLGQVLWNLLSNAIKFTPEGGRVEVGMMQIGTQLQIIVADTGEGIDPAFLPYVFERFRQADVAKRRGRQGLGLGLAVVRHIVEMHGGSVHADSAGRGLGASFTVTLPIPALVAATEDKRVGQDLLAGLSLDGVRVLVVDDEAEARDILHGALTLFGAHVQAVENADAAVNSIREWQPHVLVSDIGLAGEDGYTLIQRVRALGAAAGGQTPAIALTARARSEDRLRALAAGFQMHVAKPVEPRELALVIASLIGRLPGGVTR